MKYQKYFIHKHPMELSGRKVDIISLVDLLGGRQ